MDWPHAPLHRLDEAGAYIVTAGTYGRQHLFSTPDRLDLLQESLLSLAVEFDWALQAWTLFSNHYHFVAASPQDPTSLRELIRRLHGSTSFLLNKLDGLPGRKVWYQYWDTHLTYEKSYFARLNYVMQNPVRHGLVAVACQYRWCSASWLNARRARR